MKIVFMFSICEKNHNNLTIKLMTNTLNWSHENRDQKNTPSGTLFIFKVKETSIFNLYKDN